MAYYTGDALAEIAKMKATADGRLDYSTLPAFARAIHKVRVKRVDKNGVESHQDEEIPARDLGAMVSMLTVACQQLLDRIERLEAKP